MVALLRVPLARLTRTRRGWLVLALWTVLAVVGAVVARSHGATTGADHAMRGTFGVFVLPLATYALVGTTQGGLGLRRAIAGVVSLGADPRRAALSCVLVAVTAAALLGAVLAALVCVLAHGAHDAPLARDLPASIFVGAIGGAAYAAFFSAGAAIGKGTVSGLFLAFDWIIGSGAGVGALLTPRGHVQSLLGGNLVAETSHRASSVMLVVLLVFYLGLAVRLTRRP